MVTSAAFQNYSRAAEAKTLRDAAEVLRKRGYHSIVIWGLAWFLDRFARGLVEDDAR